MKKRLAELLLADDDIKVSSENELRQQLDNELAKPSPDYDKADKLVSAILAERGVVPDAGDISRRIAAVETAEDAFSDGETISGVEIYHVSKWRRYAAAAAAVVLVAGAGSAGVLLLGRHRNISPEIKTSEYVTAEIQETSLAVSGTSTAADVSQPLAAEVTGTTADTQTTVNRSDAAVTAEVTSPATLPNEKPAVTSAAQDNSGEVTVPSEKKPDSPLFTETAAISGTFTADGTAIPAGTVAVTVRLSEKKLFSYAEMCFTLDGYEPLTNSQGRPVITSPAHQNEFAAAGSVRGERLFFDCAYYSYHNEPFKGELFTFYVKPTDTCAAVTLDSSVFSDAVQPDTYTGSDEWYVIGDINGDGRITPADSAAVIKTINTVNSSLQYEVIKRNAEYYFPDIVSLHAAYIWNTPDEMIKDPVISETDNEILAYCADMAAGNEYSGTSYIGFKYYK